MSSEHPKSQVLQRVGECLYRNGNKTYFALVKVGGKQIKKSLKTTDLPVAKRKLADFRAKAERLNGQMRNLRFEEFAEMWMQSVKPSLKAKSFDRRRVAIVGLTPFFKGIPIRSLGFSHIDEWQTKRGAIVSARSHNIELETLRILLRYACDRGALLESPAEKFKRRKQPRTVVEMPTRNEFAEIVRHLRNSPQSVTSGAAEMVEFLAYSGMRVGEAREVRWRDINFDLGSVKVTGGENRTKNHQERSIILFAPLRNLLNRMIERRGGQATPDEKVFAIDSPRGALEAACKRAGVKSFCVHSLRHFFASNALEQGVPFKAVAHWLGHSDGGILVARTYGHLREDFNSEMALRMTFEACPEPIAVGSTLAA